MQFILSSFIWELKDVVFIVSLNHTFQLKIPLVIIFLNLHMWQKNLEQNMFCTFLLTGHLSFYDPSPHSINESILFTWTLRGRNQTSTCEYTAWNEMGTWIKIRVRTCEKHCEMGVCLAAACMLPYDPPPPHTHTHTHTTKNTMYQILTLILIQVPISFQAVYLYSSPYKKRKHWIKSEEN